MAMEVNLVGSRVSMMHLAYDCPRCGKTTTITVTDGGKDATGRRRLEQRPSECPECGMTVALSLVTADTRDGDAVR